MPQKSWRALLCHYNKQPVCDNSNLLMCQGTNCLWTIPFWFKQQSVITAQKTLCLWSCLMAMSSTFNFLNTSTGLAPSRHTSSRAVRERGEAESLRHSVALALGHTRLSEFQPSSPPLLGEVTYPHSPDKGIRLRVPSASYLPEALWGCGQNACKLSWPPLALSCPFWTQILYGTVLLVDFSRSFVISSLSPLRLYIPWGLSVSFTLPVALEGFSTALYPLVASFFSNRLSENAVIEQHCVWGTVGRINKVINE